MSSYDYNIRLENGFSRQIKAILGNYFIGQDPVLDTKEATDFTTFIVKPFRVAVRLRTEKYYLNPSYRQQFTIRWSLPSGLPTEIDKIRNGLVDYFLYGFVDANERRLLQYFIGDLAVFRTKEPTPAGIFRNNPPDSELAAYDIESLDRTFILKWWQRSSLI